MTLKAFLATVVGRGYQAVLSEGGVEGVVAEWLVSRIGRGRRFGLRADGDLRRNSVSPDRRDAAEGARHIMTPHMH